MLSSEEEQKARIIIRKAIGKEQKANAKAFFDNKLIVDNLSAKRVLDCLTCIANSEPDISKEMLEMVQGSAADLPFDYDPITAVRIGRNMATVMSTMMLTSDYWLIGKTIRMMPYILGKEPKKFFEILDTIEGSNLQTKQSFAKILNYEEVPEMIDQAEGISEFLRDLNDHGFTFSVFGRNFNFSCMEIIQDDRIIEQRLNEDIMNKSFLEKARFNLLSIEQPEISNQNEVTETDDVMVSPDMNQQKCLRFSK